MTNLSEIITTVTFVLVAIATFSLFYWAFTDVWNANPAFAAGASVVAALIIWLPKEWKRNGN